MKRKFQKFFERKSSDVKTQDELIKRAKAEGYDFEKLSEEELDAIAGGDFWDDLNNAIKTVQNIL